jgi:hypothetical protein
LVGTVKLPAGHADLAARSSTTQDAAAVAQAVSAGQDRIGMEAARDKGCRFSWQLAKLSDGTFALPRLLRQRGLQLSQMDWG